MTRMLAVVALLLCSAPAFAQNAPGQEPEPKADAGTTVQEKCIAENDEFKMRGKQPIFEIALENKCERRMTCKVFVYITGARGPVQGSGTIVLAEKSRGAAAKGSYIIKTKQNGGSSQSSRECKAI